MDGEASATPIVTGEQVVACLFMRHPPGTVPEVDELRMLADLAATRLSQLRRQQRDETAL